MTQKKTIAKAVGKYILENNKMLIYYEKESRVMLPGNLGAFNLAFNTNRRIG